MMKEFEIFQLSNGLKVIHQEFPYSNVAHLGVIANAGSRDENTYEHGIAHFIEHVIFKGTKTKKAFHILNQIDAVGGELNAYTTKEDTCVFASFLQKHLDSSIDLLADIFFNSTFPAKELEKEKIVIVDEIKSYQDSPPDMIIDEFELLLFPKHALGRDILGTKKSLQKFTKSDIQSFIKKHYTRNNVVISSIGNISADALKKKLEKHFGKYVLADTHENKIPAVNAVNSHKISKPETNQSHYILGNAAYSLQDDRKTPLVLLTNLLGGPAMNSRLNLEIREKHGLTYNIEANYSPYSDTGIFSIYFGTDKKNLNKTIELVKKELKKFCDKKLTPIQLQSAKEQILGQITLANENRVGLMLAYGKSLVTYGQVDSVKQIYNKIEKITASQILEISNEIFDEKTMSSVTYINR
ncbi:MAG: pitrilysin family protein [Bacteroidetes bacterium]|nr:pitrilysin family protein [Bacteroidota bacterium]